MESFLRSVYEVPPKDDVVKRAVEAFAEANWTHQEHLNGVADADVDGSVRRIRRFQ